MITVRWNAADAAPCGRPGWDAYDFDGSHVPIEEPWADDPNATRAEILEFATTFFSVCSFCGKRPSYNADEGFIYKPLSTCPKHGQKERSLDESEVTIISQ